MINKIEIFKDVSNKFWVYRIHHNGTTTSSTVSDLIALHPECTDRDLKSAVTVVAHSVGLNVSIFDVKIEGEVASWSREDAVGAKARKRLRDQIAMNAISGAVVNSANTVYEGRTAGTTEKLYDVLAKRAYELADAMLRARDA